jgi:hypothetical protein
MVNNVTLRREKGHKLFFGFGEGGVWRAGEGEVSQTRAKPGGCSSLQYNESPMGMGPTQSLSITIFKTLKNNLTQAPEPNHYMQLPTRDCAVCAPLINTHIVLHRQ